MTQTTTIQVYLNISNFSWSFKIQVPHKCTHLNNLCLGDIPIWPIVFPWVCKYILGLMKINLIQFVDSMHVSMGNPPVWYTYRLIVFPCLCKYILGLIRSI